MNTSAFSFYLLPFVFRRWWKQKQGRSVDSRVANEYQPLALDEDIAEVDTCVIWHVILLNSFVAFLDKAASFTHSR